MHNYDFYDAMKFSLFQAKICIILCNFAYPAVNL